jgi:hypothetical protein
MPSLRMRERKVLGCNPKMSAAPFGPSILQFVCCKTSNNNRVYVATTAKELACRGCIVVYAPE